MILDNAMQKQFLLELFGVVNVPGNLLELAYATKQAIANAQVQEPRPPDLSRLSDDGAQVSVLRPTSAT